MFFLFSYRRKNERKRLKIDKLWAYIQGRAECSLVMVGSMTPQKVEFIAEALSGIASDGIIEIINDIKNSIY